MEHIDTSQTLVTTDDISSDSQDLMNNFLYNLVQPSSYKFNINLDPGILGHRLHAWLKAMGYQNNVNPGGENDLSAINHILEQHAALLASVYSTISDLQLSQEQDRFDINSLLESLSAMSSLVSYHDSQITAYFFVTQTIQSSLSGIHQRINDLETIDLAFQTDITGITTQVYDHYDLIQQLDIEIQQLASEFPDLQSYLDDLSSNIDNLSNYVYEFEALFYEYHYLLVDSFDSLAINVGLLEDRVFLPPLTHLYLECDMYDIVANIQPIPNSANQYYLDVMSLLLNSDIWMSYPEEIRVTLPRVKLTIYITSDAASDDPSPISAFTYAEAPQMPQMEYIEIRNRTSRPLSYFASPDCKRLFSLQGYVTFYSTPSMNHYNVFKSLPEIPGYYYLESADHSVNQELNGLFIYGGTPFTTLYLTDGNIGFRPYLHYYIDLTNQPNDLELAMFNSSHIPSILHCNEASLSVQYSSPLQSSHDIYVGSQLVVTIPAGTSSALIRFTKLYPHSNSLEFDRVILNPVNGFTSYYVEQVLD